MEKHSKSAKENNNLKNFTKTAKRKEKRMKQREINSKQSRIEGHFSKICVVILNVSGLNSTINIPRLPDYIKTQNSGMYSLWEIHMKKIKGDWKQGKYNKEKAKMQILILDRVEFFVLKVLNMMIKQHYIIITGTL